MKLTKEECLMGLSKLTSIKAIELLKDEPQYLNEYEKYCNMLEQLIEERFDLEKRWKEVLEDNELLNKEIERLKRRIKGMEQNISNQRQQLESHYKSIR